MQRQTLYTLDVCRIWPTAQAVFPGLTGSEQVLDQLQVSLLRSLHQRGGAAQLDVGPRLDEEVRHLQEAATASQGQRRLLGLLRLGVNVST